MSNPTNEPYPKGPVAVGEPLLPETPTGRSVEIPGQYRGHPLLNAGPYFTLPRALLEAVVTEVGKERFDSRLLEMEYALSDVCQDHIFEIGFWGGRSIRFQLLRPNYDLPGGSLVSGLGRFGKSEEEARTILALGGQRFDWTANVRRGYCGWLMTNEAFLGEHRQIFDDWKEEIAQNGIPYMGPVLRDVRVVPGSERAQNDREHFLREFEEFFIRWRLEGMPAPFLPQPMGTHLPVGDLRPVLGHMSHGGTSFFIPDICPVPSRDKLREILEDALRDRNAPEYLGEWFKIVQSDNVAKNQIPHYARIFEIQHYLRAFYTRHATALKRKKSALVNGLAEFLGVSDDSFERDRRRVRPTVRAPD
jgi:hypothetical protein